MSLSTLSGSVPSFADAFGTGLVGSWIAMCLYGLTTTQAYLYWVNYPRDSPWTKLLVVFFWVLNTAHTICMCHATYYHLITIESNFFLILTNIWSLNMTILLHTIVSVTVMLYYTKMIFNLSSNQLRWWLTGAIAVPVLFGLGFGLDVSVRMFLSSNLLDLSQFSRNTILPALILQLISDALITGSLCVLLYNKRTEFKRTRHIINTLIIYAASRGLVTLLVTLVIVLALVIQPNQMWYSGPEFIVTGLYTNSLMTVLNTRRPSCEVTERSPADSLERKPQLSLPGGRRQGDIHVADRTTNVEFIELSAKGSSDDDHNRVTEIKAMV